MKWAIVMALAAGVAYALLWQASLYGEEASWLEQVTTGAPPRSRHAPYVEVLAALSRLPGATQLGLHRYACWLNAAAAAVGLVAFAATLRRVLPGSKPWLGLAMLASCPAVIFHATSPQPHALAFALASLTTWAAARAATTSSTLPAVVAGALSGPAYWFDPMSPLLLVWLLPFFAAGLRRRGTSVLLAAAVASVGLAHALAFGWTPATWPPLLGDGALASADALAPGNLASIAGKQALRAFLPLSLVVVAGLFYAPSARWAWMTALATAIHVVAQASLSPSLALEGAALLSFGIAATLVAARVLGPHGQLAVAALGLALGTTKLAAHGDPDAKAFAIGARALGDESMATWLVSSDEADLTACVVWLPRSELIRLVKVYVPTDPAQVAPLVRAYLQKLHAEGRRVYLTWEAERELRLPYVRERFPGAVALLGVLQRDYALVQVEHGRLRAKEVRPR